MTREVPICPDCESPDVTYCQAEDPPYYCWQCGIRFRSPVYRPEDEVRP